MFRATSRRLSDIWPRPLAPNRPSMIAEADRRELLRLARETLAAHLNHTPLAPVPQIDAAAHLAGAFVTLHNNEELRGCIGHVEATEPLGSVIRRCTVAAASSDPRFPAVTTAELPNVDIELSVLGPLEPVTSIDEIEVGRH